MISVNLLLSKETILGYEISGHADYDEHGKDIVCAAVSILAYTCVNTLELYTDDFIFSDDDITMKLISNYTDEKVEVVFTSFKTGIWTLTQSYKDFIKLNYKEIWNDIKY